MGFCRWNNIHIYALAAGNINFKVIIGDDISRECIKTFVRGDTEVARWDEALWDTAVWDYENPIKHKFNLNRKIKGNSVYLEITQTADDINLALTRVYLTGIIKRTRKS